MSENTVNAVPRRLGYSRDEITEESRRRASRKVTAFVDFLRDVFQVSQRSGVARVEAPD